MIKSKTINSGKSILRESELRKLIKEVGIQILNENMILEEGIQDNFSKISKETLLSILFTLQSLGMLGVHVALNPDVITKIQQTFQKQQSLSSLPETKENFEMINDLIVNKKANAYDVARVYKFENLDALIDWCDRVVKKHYPKLPEGAPDYPDAKPRSLTDLMKSTYQDLDRLEKMIKKDEESLKNRKNQKNQPNNKK